MKYIFYDIECANCYQGKGKICSFGYVVTDENFGITEQYDMVINPASKFNLGPDIKLAYSKSEFRQAPLFPMFYDEIEALLTDPDSMVFGFSVNNDARYVRDECRRYDRPPINYRFYDVQQMFMGYANVKNQPSLAGICEQYGINESQEIHKSDDDSRMTMEALQTLCRITGKSVPELIGEYPRCVGESADGEIKWLFAPVHEKPEPVVRSHSKSNAMARYTNNYKHFRRYISRLRPAVDEGLPFLGKKVCISANYEEKHYFQMREIARRIADLGGKYCMYANECSLFVTYDSLRADGTPKSCSRLNRVMEIIGKKGKKIEIMPFSEFLELIGTSEEELDGMVPAREAVGEDSVGIAESDGGGPAESGQSADLEEIPAVNA